MEEQDNRNYIQNKVHPIYERMLIDLLLNKPEDTVDYMINWLKNKGSQFQTSYTGTTSLQALKQNVKKGGNDEGEIASEEEEEEEGDDYDQDYIQKLEKQKAKNQLGRSSVSAEVFGVFNKKGDFKARVIQKSQEAKSRIVKRLQQAFMFSALDEKEREIVVDAMEEKNFMPGDFVIQQGEDGDVLYVVDNGELDCFKKFSKDQAEPTYLKTYQPGESFGELSLLYNAPRAATIKSKSQATCFSLDRDTFNHIVKDAAQKKRDKYEEFLGKVQLLQGMDPYDRSKIADAVKNVSVKKGEFVIKQGEEGDTFFMIEEGNLTAWKSENGQQAKPVYNYNAGMFFGELALQNNAPRAASVQADADCKLIALDRYSFKRLLGPVDELIAKTKDTYK